MFGEEAFGSWMHLLTGALCFALLFAFVAAMAELLLFGEGLRLTSGAVAIGALAFVGYFGAALLGRREPPANL